MANPSCTAAQGMVLDAAADGWICGDVIMTPVSCADTELLGRVSGAWSCVVSTLVWLILAVLHLGFKTRLGKLGFWPVH